MAGFGQYQTSIFYRQRRDNDGRRGCRLSEEGAQRLRAMAGIIVTCTDFHKKPIVCVRTEGFCSSTVRASFFSLSAGGCGDRRVPFMTSLPTFLRRKSCPSNCQLIALIPQTQIHWHCPHSACWPSIICYTLKLNNKFTASLPKCS